jgi:hypothetical protein
MTAISIIIPNHEVSAFENIITKTGWMSGHADVRRVTAAPRRPVHGRISHAFGQLRQMKDGILKGNLRRACPINYKIDTMSNFAPGLAGEPLPLNERQRRRLLRSELVATHV